MISAFAYTRVSGLTQADGDGPDRQLLAIKRFAVVQGAEIVRVYNETLTGKTELDNRPVLSQLRTDLLANGTRVVIIERLDRLARDLLVQEAIIADFRKHELEIVSTVEPDLCSTEPTRVLLRQMMGAFAQYERCMIVAKMAGARQRLKDRGELHMGRPKFGYLKVRRDRRVVLEPHPEEHPILLRMQRMQSERYTWTAIANELNGMGIKTRQGSTWFPSTVAKILSRE